MACATCRARKIKCDGARPTCKNCSLRSSHCTYAGERRKSRRPHDGERYSSSLHRDETDSLSGSGSRNGESNHHPTTAYPTNAHDDTVPEGLSWGPDVHYTSPRLTEEVRTALLDRILDGRDESCLKDSHPAVWMRAGGGDEYTGPSSGISFISDMGLEWISKQVPGSATLCDIILKIRISIIGHLRQPKCVPTESVTAYDSPADLQQILPADLAEYVEAYFSTVQDIFPVLDEANFKSQLSELGAEPAQGMFTWRCLVNAVMASGCRAALSEESPTGFQTSGRRAWGYFRNALFYQNKWLHGPTDLFAVQALAVMTIFAQGMSSPQRLEYTLSSAATRMAQSLGLHRHPPGAWNLSESEKQERNRLFWVIFCLDKTIALRCGRPSVISDDEISCCFPRDVLVVPRQDQGVQCTDDSPSFYFFLCFAKLTRICGVISRTLYSAEALCSTPYQLQAQGNRLLRDLEVWHQGIPTQYRPGRPLRRLNNSCTVSQVQLLTLHSSYYYAVCAIHRRFHPMFTREDSFQDYLQVRSISHAQAARSLIMLTKYLDMESYTPSWLLFYFPMMALSTIFMHVVCNPSDSSAYNDIALMDVVVGFFGRLEFLTSGEASFTKTSEFVRQARSVVECSKLRGNASVPRLQDHDEMLDYVNFPRDHTSGATVLDGMLMGSNGDTGRDHSPRRLQSQLRHLDAGDDAQSAQNSFQFGHAKMRTSHTSRVQQSQQSITADLDDMDMTAIVLPFGEISNDMWSDGWMSTQHHHQQPVECAGEQGN